MREYVRTFCDSFEYPQEAKEVLLLSYDKLKADILEEQFKKHIKLFENNELVDYGETIRELDDIACKISTHRYTIHLLFLICLSKHTKKLYDEQGISEKIYVDTMYDLKIKAFECYQLYDVWGNFVAAEWEFGILDLSIFALGRLQFAPTKFEGTYSKNGHTIHPGDTVIDVHIPSGTGLRYEDCMKSYQEAEKFFEKRFLGSVTPFVCYSWLLYPPNKEILPENSNILKFIKDYDMINVSVDEEKTDLWRIYYKEANKVPVDLPRTTSLQRAYADWLSQGNKVGLGHGVFFMENGNIF
jgi:hypothetical protein